jgi:HEAT repeat protein
VPLLLAPVGVIAVVGFAELPRARTEGHVQRIKGGEASVAELIEALESENPSQRFWAVQELQKMGPQAKGAVPALAEVLDDPTEVSGPGTVVTAAAKALAAIGPEAEPAIPALVEAIKREQGKRSETGSDTPSVLSSLAGKALTKIGPASIPELTTLLAHEDRYVRMTAVDALGNMGSQAKETVPAINEALSDQDESVRQSAGVALERIAGHRPVSD